MLSTCSLFGFAGIICTWYFFIVAWITVLLSMCSFRLCGHYLYLVFLLLYELLSCFQRAAFGFAGIICTWYFYCHTIFNSRPASNVHLRASFFLVAVFTCCTISFPAFQRSLWLCGHPTTLVLIVVWIPFFSSNLDFASSLHSSALQRTGEGRGTGEREGEGVPAARST